MVLAENRTFDTINGPFPSDGLFAYSDRTKVKTPSDPGEETGTDKPHSSPEMFGQVPNISGGFEDRRSDALWPTSGQNPFWSGGRAPSGDRLWAIDNSRTGDHNTITFDASRSSALYSGASVQPKGINALPCIRF